MIARLRKRHRRLWLVLAWVIPAIILWAWHERGPSAVMERLPAALMENPSR